MIWNQIFMNWLENVIQSVVMGIYTEVIIDSFSSVSGNQHPHVDGDEDLARALQASLDLEEPSPRPTASRVQNISAGRR